MLQIKKATGTVIITGMNFSEETISIKAIRPYGSSIVCEYGK